MKRCFFGLLALTLTLMVFASAPQKPNSAKLAEEFQKLQQDFYKAMDVYYAPYEAAKTDEERAKIKLDPAKDPALKYLPKFQALAKKAEGDMTVGPQIEATLIQIAPDADKKIIQTALDHLTGIYLKSPVLDKYLFAIGLANDRIYGWQTPAGSKAKMSALMNIESKSPHKNVKAAALFRRGEILSSRYETSTRDVAAATRVFNRVISLYGDTNYAKRAQSSLFEMNNLNFGQTAPDFEATDENGVKWKLSDYRGKVVVLDFWGFW